MDMATRVNIDMYFDRQTVNRDFGVPRSTGLDELTISSQPSEIRRSCSADQILYN